MRIRNSCLSPPPSTLSPLSPKRLHCSDDQITFDRSPESPHVMISRINGRINNDNSTTGVFNNQLQEQNQGIDHEEEETNFAPGAQSLVGGWREEEKAMPLKKRRMVSSEERRENMDRGKMVKVDKDLTRCGRTDGRRWRCSRRRVEGYSMCEHHLLTRSARYRSENLKREIDEEEGDEKKQEDDEGSFGKCENDDDNNNNNNNNKRKVVKARSINSLLRDTDPLMPLNL